MRRIFIGLLVVVLLLAGLDFVTKAWVESKVEAAAKRELPDAVAVDAEIDSFPILARLAATGKVKRFVIDFSGVESKPIDVTLLHLELHDVRFDRGSLFGRPRISDIGFVELSAVVSEDAVRTLTGADIRLFPDGATIKVGNNIETARAELTDKGIELTFGTSTRVLIPLPDLDVVPCDVRFHFQRGGLVLTCTTTKVPKILVDALGNAALKGLTG